MRIGVISDIHCNAFGLQEALRLMGDVDELLCLGDCISQVRFSNEVIAVLRERRAHVVLGNHDIEYLSRLADTEGQRRRTDPELVAWLREQPQRIDLEFAGKSLVMVHATPWTYDYVYPGSKEMARFAEVEADFVLGGHTHTPFIGRIGRPLVINPGSAGHTAHHPDGALLACAVLDPKAGEAEIIRFPDKPLDD